MGITGFSGLSPRLEAVARLVPPGKVAADIGTDHAYLPLYLVRENISPRVIAGEKNQGPLEKARKLVELYDLGERVLLRPGDGLEVIRPWDGIKVVIIAGMGGETISNILHKGRDKLKGLDLLILQPMTRLTFLRKWLLERGFIISQEKLAREGDRFYVIMEIIPPPGEGWGPRGWRVAPAGAGLDLSGSPGGWGGLGKEALIELGPRLLDSGDPLLKPYLEYRLRACQKILENLIKTRKDKTTAGEKYAYWRAVGIIIQLNLKKMNPETKGGTPGG